MAGFIHFHLEVSGCRTCLANLDDLKNRQVDEPAAVDSRRKKYFQSSAGHLRRPLGARRVGLSSFPNRPRRAGEPPACCARLGRVKMRTPSQIRRFLRSHTQEHSPIMTCRAALISPFVLLACTVSSFAADLSRAVVVAPDDLSPREKKAVEMLVDEVHKRTQIRWKVAGAWPTDGAARSWRSGDAASLPAFAGKLADELAKEPAGRPPKVFASAAATRKSWSRATTSAACCSASATCCGSCT